MKIADFLIEAAAVPISGELFKIEHVQTLDSSFVAHNLKTDTGGVLVIVQLIHGDGTIGDSKDVTLVGTKPRLTQLARSMKLKKPNDHVVPAPEFKVTDISFTCLEQRHDGSFSDGIWASYPKKYLDSINEHFNDDQMLIIYVGKNKNEIKSMDAAMIHPAMINPKIDGVVVLNPGSNTKAIKLRITKGLSPVVKINQNSDYQFFMHSFEDITTHKQMMAGGPYVFDLDFRRNGQHPDKHNWAIWIYKNGYVRVNRGNKIGDFMDLAVIVKPKGDTSEEKYLNAWHGAAEWAKNFLKRKDTIK